jgi:hypothetical protein
LAEKGHLEALRRTLDALRPDLTIWDSLVALQQGEENSATDRRHFYNQVLAPIKAEYGCGILLAAHPPLPTKDAHPESQKRPRGSGDIIAQVDRSLWMYKVSETKSLTQYTFKSALEAFLSREGGDIEPAVVIINGLETEPVTVEAEFANTAAGTAALGDINACTMEILHVLRALSLEATYNSTPMRVMYQPDLSSHCEEKGWHKKHVYQPAINKLKGCNQVEILPPKKGTGKSGKWVRLTESDDD